MIIGITGGTGCGKTTLLECIRDAGGMLLDCDAIYHQLLETDRQMLTAIEERFPGTVEQGVLNRKKLGQIVFADSQALLDLNGITHAAVREYVLCKLETNPALAAIDAIALFESGLAELCDVTVAVTAPLEIRVERLMKRDGIEESYARSRIQAQPDESWFRQHCDYVIENNGSFQHFASNCVAFLQSLDIIKQ